MQRTFNYTGRSRIAKEEVLITIDDRGDLPPVFDAEFKFQRNFPDRCRLYVEAYHRETLQRFDFGTIANPVAPQNRVLDSVDLTGTTLFRVRVVDESGDIGRLIGAADSLRPEGDDDQNRESLMVLKSRDLGSVPWQVELDAGGSKPALLVNNRIPDAINRAKNDPTFYALVMPAVLRQVLTDMALNEDAEEDLDADGTRQQWIQMAEGLNSTIPKSGDREEKLSWVEGVVQAFCQSNEIIDVLVKRIEEESA
ncbi:hypothetical protein ACYVVU_05460 [Arenicellales bacterium IMCC55707]